MYKINIYNISSVRSQVVILTQGLYWLIMYVSLDKSRENV